MTTRQIINEVRLQLAGKYPEREIESFVRILFKRYVALVSLPMIYDVELSPDVERQMLSAVNELKNYCPIQYILGETEFYGLPLEVTPDVLIPRPETEELVDWIVRKYDKSMPLSIVDIGAGSGCIAVSLKSNFHNATVWAIDVSKAALTVGKRNAAKNNVEVNFLLKDALNDDMMGFERDSLDVLVSNPPYVTSSDAQQMQPNVLDYEPYIALFTPENDPLVFFKRISAFGKKSLKEGGRIFFEINEAFHEEVADILKQHDYSDISLRRDINGKWRMISGQKNFQI